MTTVTKADLTKMSVKELAAALKAKKSEEKASAAAQRKDYDTMRDGYVDTVFNKMEEYSKLLKDFKVESVKLGLELHDKMYEVYGREKRDGVDHYSLVSADGMRKVVIERQHRCEYDETAEVAITQIKEVLRAKFANRNKGMYDMLESVLLKNGKGDYDEKLVAKLRKHEATVDDPRFNEALATLAAAYRPISSQTYIRAYRKSDTGKWEDMVMNWSGM